jgi:4-aminobutyrate aminotransferase-like enzyme/Ser/Thr protein kinase RdoA (MazF antagonist)
MSQITELALSLYSLTATATPLDGEYDTNMRLTTPDGEQYLLKIARAGEERSLLEMQNALLNHLAERVPDLPMQRVLPAPNGDLISEISDAAGEQRYVRLLSYVPGRLLVHTRPHTPALLESLGRTLARIDLALADFDHPAAHRILHWDLARSSWIGEKLGAINDPARRAVVQRHLERFEAEVLPQLGDLPHSVIHGDANDYNVLVAGTGYDARVTSLIDVGDCVWSATVCDLAIALAYAVLDKPDPLTSAAHVVRGYHAVHPLSEAEIALLYPLMLTRLAASVTNSAHRKLSEPDNAYLLVSEAPAWAALKRCEAIHPRLAHYTLRHACGLPAVPHGPALERWLEANSATFAPVMAPDPRTVPVRVLDLSIGSLDIGDLPLDEPSLTVNHEEHKAHEGQQELKHFKTSRSSRPSWLHSPQNTLTARIERLISEAGAAVGVGRYDEARAIYTTEAFRTQGEETDEWRTIHIGLDLFAGEGTPVLAPLAGVVHSFYDNAAPCDYGPCIVLEHRVPELPFSFYTLYGHLSRESLVGLEVGQPITAGQQLAAFGSAEVNGGWPPHLHFQIVLDMLDRQGEFPGVARPSDRALWRELSPNPASIVGVGRGQEVRSPRIGAEILARRREVIGPNLSVSYRKPITMVRAAGAYMFDEDGQRYTDAYNNVPHVGHSHPHVAQAAARQMALLNTNTRYLHDNLVSYAERLLATFPKPLEVCYLVNSGSEANELAIRLARTYTGQHDIIISEGAYHGNTNTLVDLSPYKAEGPGGKGLAPWAHKAPVPDVYRGPYFADDPHAGWRYAQAVGTIIAKAQAEGRGIAAFMIESILSCGGQIVFPEGYLAECYRLVRAAGGVTIADEVQTGLGRVGSHFWAFETQGVVPDIVAMGKPIGNGFPLGAVVTTRAVADAFNNGMEWFSTFGGNPVACAVGNAVLDVIEQEGLQAHAGAVGEYMLGGLRELMARHEAIGDVRGLGLFLGIELVRDRATREPDAALTSYAASRMRDFRVLTGTDGLYHNVLKIKPPLVFAKHDADTFIEVLDRVLQER